MQFKGELDSARIITVLDDYAGYETSFLAQHGIAILLEASSGGVCKRVLLDAGQSALPILHNLELLGIDPCSIDAVVVSHCHYDHTEGLVDVLKAIGRENVPVVAHTTMFRPNYIFDPFIRNIGVTGKNGPAAIEGAGGVLVLVDEPFEIMPGVIVTGEVPRRRAFEKQGIGTYNIEEGRVVPDEIASEPRVDLAIGGFHLIEASPERIRDTAQALKDLDVGKVVTGHCTGLAALCEFSRVLGDRFEQLHVGTTIEL